MALMTPTSLGLRHALTSQGVDFSLPLSSEQDKLLEGEVATANSWLKEMAADSPPYPDPRGAVVAVFHMYM